MKFNKIHQIKTDIGPAVLYVPLFLVLVFSSLYACTGKNLKSESFEKVKPAEFNSLLVGLAGFVPVSLALADFDEDGIQDFVVAQFSSTSIGVFSGDGEGDFDLIDNFRAGGKPYAVTALDLNGDGHTDIAAACWGRNGGVLAVLLSDGKGRFQKTSFTPLTLKQRLTGVVPGDFDGDSITDLALTDAQGNQVILMKGDGRGGFEKLSGLDVGTFPKGVVSGDFNGDGKTDIATANDFSNSVSILLNEGHGNFKHHEIPVGSGPSALVSNDFDGDGKVDLGVSLALEDAVLVLLGSGTGEFRVSGKFAVEESPRAVSSGDFSGDGFLDIAVANFKSHTLTILLGNGKGSFGKARHIPVGATPRAVATGDLNGDKRLDLAVANWGSSDISILLNTTP